MLTVDVTLRVGDVYDPWRNYLRWAIALFVCYLLYDTRSNWSPASAGPGGRPDFVAIPTLIILCAAILFLYPYLRLRSIFHNYPVLGSSRHFSFSDVGMHLETQDGRADLNWSAFYRIVETRRVFIFMQTHRGGTYVPK